MRFIVVMLLAVTGCAKRPAPQPPSLPVIVDTDAGSDDLIALLWLMRQPSVKLEAVTITTGLAHPKEGAETVLRLLEAGGLTETPVYVGTDRPITGRGAFPAAWRKSADVLLRDEFPQARRRPEGQMAAQFLASRLAEHDKPVRILALGPLTNLGRAIRLDQRTGAAVSELVWMGGALHVPGNVPAAPTAEWNAWVDPEAAELVLQTGWKTRIVPLDATNKVPIDQPVLTLFEQQAREWGASVVLRLLRTEAASIRKGQYFAWDVLAAMAMVEPAIVQTDQVAITVRKRPRQRGRLVAVEGVHPNAAVAISADAKRFRELFTRLLP